MDHYFLHHRQNGRYISRHAHLVTSFYDSQQQSIALSWQVLLETIETESTTFAVAVSTAYCTTAFTHCSTSATQNGDRKRRDVSRITSMYLEAHACFSVHSGIPARSRSVEWPISRVGRITLNFSPIMLF